MIYKLAGFSPEISTQEVYIAADARLIAKVRIKDNASIWFGAVLRGDAEWIEIGNGSNIQDNSVLHTDPGYPLLVGENVTVGHLTILHGCSIGDGSLIGMGSTIMNGCRIGRDCLIGARTLLTEGKEIPDRSIVRGSPGKIVGEVSAEHLEMLARVSKSYQERARFYLEQIDR
jgi:carbonic anhydrase/acetyltransferase-like protein (isoleucine patch superfamily)